MSPPATETIAFRMNMNPGQAEEYRRRHDDIWPALSEALIAAGVIDYRIFLDPQSDHLFAVMTRRVDHTLADLPGTDVMQRWWAMMADIMQAGPDNVPVQVDLDPVFHLRAPGL
ncbi:L-rhamnose mutarotase [Brevundimonas subvibrioides]|uniref:L-rhamnose mutarotase n=1 Tax=Brevundimonas subvibrioides (strain ATCC 15264 / DSM 4735 / LMG 14903 / NBRC 16000 / CB 81) TaxID=633149 RepID=D9QN17_BRESC|nr:L-rhamnose mutarotase [Brevundimonas subvibrioides]ADL02173.1 L-rhamnose 1-epimerase [Brevundimonas subvibrioides ATCC 15264]